MLSQGEINILKEPRMRVVEIQILTKTMGQIQKWFPEFLLVLLEGFITFKSLYLLAVSNASSWKDACTKRT